MFHRGAYWSSTSQLGQLAYSTYEIKFMFKFVFWIWSAMFEFAKLIIVVEIYVLQILIIELLRWNDAY